jgi:EAL domain-containing protein (putative c-di-GMP-specific phosphodiesterase class I)
MKIDCVVEGVETLEQVDVLQRLGCAKMQRYFFARPLDFKDARAFARTLGAVALTRTSAD